MYKTDYFIRFVLDKNQARRDRRRGYSFSSYVFCQTKQELREYWNDFGVYDFEIGRCREGFGLRLDGLCGFGPYASIEEAEEDARKRGGYNGVDYPIAAIYTGRYTGIADQMDGDLFSADRLVKTIKL